MKGRDEGEHCKPSLTAPSSSHASPASPLLPSDAPFIKGRTDGDEDAQLNLGVLIQVTIPPYCTSTVLHVWIHCFISFRFASTPVHY